MKQTLVIGYGNPLRGDDGVGWRVAEAAAAVLPDPPVSVLAVQLLTPELADPISRSDLLILIDAAAEGPPGEVRCFPIAAGSAAAASLAIGTHEVTLDRLLGMAQELFGHCPPAYMVTIAGESFEVSETLTPTVEAAAAEALARVLELAGLPDSTQ
jgi:hydrogenase maturation protease